jgi:hypothetical protein
MQFGIFFVLYYENEKAAILAKIFKRAVIRLDSSCALSVSSYFSDAYRVSKLAARRVEQDSVQIYTFCYTFLSLTRWLILLSLASFRSYSFQMMRTILPSGSM